MKKGISLITLVITIIVIVILAGIILLNLSSSNIIDEAERAVILNDLDSFKHELRLFTVDEMLANNDSYNLETLQANSSSVYFEGTIDPDDRTIYNIIPSLENNSRYEENDIIIEDGEIIYVGSDETIINNYPDENVRTSEPEIVISNIKVVNRYSSNEIIEFLVTVTDENEITSVDLSNKVSILNSNDDILYTYEDSEITSTENILYSNKREITISLAANSLSIDGIYTIMVDPGIAINQYGKSNSVGKSFGFELDSTPPETPVIVLDPSIPTTGNVVATITYPVDAITKEYSIDGGSTWITYTTPVIITDNGSIIARAKDDLGNISNAATKNITNIDRIPPDEPTISQNPTGATNGDVTVTISYSADSDTKQYRIDSGLWNTYTVPFTVSSNVIIEARGIDEAGNESNIASREITNIDRVAPDEPTISQNPTGATNGDVTVTISYSTDSDTKQYRIDSGLWNTYTAPFTVSSNVTIEASGIDEAGNKSNIVSRDITNIDTVAPSQAEIIAFPTTPTNGNVTVTINYPVDVVTKQLSLDGGSNWYTYNGEILMSNNGTVIARGYDAVGNLSEVSTLTVTNIDTTPPNIPTISQNPTTSTSGNVTVTISYSVDSNTKQYKIGTGSWQTYSNSFTVSENTTIYARGYDVVGNESDIASRSINNIQDDGFGTNGNTSTGVASVLPPILKGMTPVRWSGTTEYTTTSTNSSWYAYKDQGSHGYDGKTSYWANAKTSDGSYFVWIPRFAYKIQSGYHSSSTGEIDVVFVDTANKDKYGNDYTSGYNGFIIHPAFTFGTTEVSGFWFAKFESSNNSGKIRVKPGYSSWRNISISSAFDICYYMGSNSIYGFSENLTGKTHMMRNSEWGAVTYLTHSQYGRNGNEININNNSNYITGIGGSSPSASSTTSTTYNYTTTYGRNSSTTGNITGIYDMSGGSWERVTTNYSGYIGSAGSATMFTSIRNNERYANRKYFEIYTGYSSDRIGGATYDTSSSSSNSTSWFGEYSHWYKTTYPWLSRGGGYSGGSAGAGLFVFGATGGGATVDGTFRPVISID